MAHPRLLARALLIVMLGIGLLAAPLLLTVDWAGAASIPQPRSATVTGTAAFVPGGQLIRYQRAPLLAPPTDVLISEFRTQGPSPNGHDQDEFIELFNPTSGSISLVGYTLHSSLCSGSDSPLPVDLSGVTLVKGQHYLIGGLNYSGSTPADQTVDLGLTDYGGIALYSGTTIVDQVGTCPSPSYVEGDPLTPKSLITDWSYDRNSSTVPAEGGVCVDTNNNAADFFLRSPSDPQNSSSPITACGNPTATPVAPTATITRTPTLSPTPFGLRILVINEVGWAGTQDDSTAQWIELYNPGALDVDLTNWTVYTPGTTFAIHLAGTVKAKGYFLLVHGSNSQATATVAPTPPSCLAFEDVRADQVFTDPLMKTNGQSLYLQDPTGNIRDTADRYGGRWPAGQLSPPKSMERSNDLLADTTVGAWFTFDGTGTAHDCGGHLVLGTPRDQNWAVGKTATPSPTPAPTKKPTPRPPTPFAHVVINEFLPRAGTDWNADGSVDVYDEFIEVKNLGPIDVDLKNWKLDGDPNLGSTPYTLPSTKLKAGQRVVFYGSQTHILLRDSGDTVRLLNAAGIVFDARSYGPVSEPDQSHCRIPDGLYWRFPCFPTPGLENQLTGVAPAAPPVAVSKPPPCLLADTVPDAFRLAECNGYGDDIWSRTWWDDLAGHALFLVPDLYSKWQTLVE